MIFLNEMSLYKYRNIDDFVHDSTWKVIDDLIYHSIKLYNSDDSNSEENSDEETITTAINNVVDFATENNIEQYKEEFLKLRDLNIMPYYKIWIKYFPKDIEKEIKNNKQFTNGEMKLDSFLHYFIYGMSNQMRKPIIKNDTAFPGTEYYTFIPIDDFESRLYEMSELILKLIDEINEN